MAEMREFETVEEMKQHVADYWSEVPGYDKVTADDVSWSKDYGEDERIGWKHWRYVYLRDPAENDEHIVGMMDYKG